MSHSLKNSAYFLMAIFVLLTVGCGERAKRYIDAGTAAHDDFQEWLIKQIGEAKVLRAELDRRIGDLQKLEKDLTKLEAESRVRIELLPKQKTEAEKELAETKSSREKLVSLLASSSDSIKVGAKTYSRSSAEQMSTSLEVEEEKLRDRLEALERNRERLVKAGPVLLEKRDSVRKTLMRVKAAREKLDAELSEAALAKRIEDSVGGGEKGVAEVESRIKRNAEELTVKVRSDIVVSDDVINEAAGSQEMKELRAALSKI